MDFVYCPNGHPNRPGTRICAVCRALVEQRVPSTPADVIDESGSSPKASASPKRHRIWPWILLLLLLLGLAVVTILAFFYPLTRSTSDQISSTPILESTVAVVDGQPLTPVPTVVDTSVATDVPTDVPTTLPEPTATEESLPTAVPTITPLSTIIGVVITPTFSFGPGANLLQNGDFSSDWANGWTSEVVGDSGEIEVRPLPDDPNTQGLHLERAGPGHLRVAQRVVLTYPVEGLEFQARVRAAGTTAGEVENRAAILLRYEDADGDPIGASIWLDQPAVSTNLWDSSALLPPNVARVERSLDEGWQTLMIGLGDEFTGVLSAVNPVDVRQITVFLALIGTDGCDPATCSAMLDVAELSLVPELP